jgi:hypothetical protein
MMLSCFRREGQRASASSVEACAFDESNGGSEVKGGEAP